MMMVLEARRSTSIILELVTFSFLKFFQLETNVRFVRSSHQFLELFSLCSCPQRDQDATEADKSPDPQGRFSPLHQGDLP